jgi:hypothetical protein
MKYVMLILDTENSAALSADDRNAWNSQIMAWYEKHSTTGKVPDMGAQLQPASTAKTIRSGTVTDGPFIESKEVLGGYSVLEAGSYDEAVDLAQTWPGVDRGLVSIELRPVVEF